MKTIECIERHRLAIIIGICVCILLTTIPLSKLTINPDLESYLPVGMPSMIDHRKINEDFGNMASLYLVMEAEDILESATLDRLNRLTKAFESSPEVEEVISLTNSSHIISAEGMMMVLPTIPEIGVKEIERENLRASVRQNDLAFGTLISADFRFALVIINTRDQTDDVTMIESIRSIINAHPGVEKLYLTGQPYLRYAASKNISRDLIVLLPAGLIVMLLFLWLSFREVKVTLLPFMVVIFAILFSMALLPAFGWELSLIGVLIPIMMIAIANNYGVHVVARYQELNAYLPDVPMSGIIRQAMLELHKPVIICGITTIIGILGLLAHILIPARQMGIIAGAGIGLALLLSLTFIPAVMTYMQKSKVHPGVGRHARGIFHQILTSAGSILTQHPRRILLWFTLLFAVCTFGLRWLKVAPDSNQVLPPQHEFNEAIQLLNAHFGGSKMIQIVFEGDVLDPDFLKRLEQAEAEWTAAPLIGRTVSITTLIRTMSKALNDPDEAEYDAIPESREAIAQYLELYAMSASAEELERFINLDYTKIILNLQFQSDHLQSTLAIQQLIHEQLKNEALTYYMGGWSLIDLALSRSVERGQYYSLAAALLAIFVLLSLIFRSFTAGWMGSLPLLIAVCCTFGLMGWLGIELNIVTALMSSISIGLGVDFTIHVFWRMKSELQQHQWNDAAFRTIKGIGRGITINAFSVMMGFSVLFLSSFNLIQSFAFLIILSLFLCLISALLLIPCLCLLMHPAFLIKNQVKPKKHSL